MKTIKSFFAIATLILMISCGGKDEKKDNKQIKRGTNTEKKAETKEEPKKSAAEMIDMDNKGIGPVKNVELDENIDQSMAKKGEAVFKSKCLACHKPTKKFIGPAPKGILDRRAPEWVMNMILNPEKMIKEDPIAKQLLIDHNGSPMANQGLTEEESRQILEYFRTL